MPLGYSSLSKEEWEGVRTLADDRNTVIKKAGKGSYGTETTILERQKVSLKTN